MKTIETERLLLREWRTDDDEALYEYAKSPLVGPAAGWKPHESIEETREYLQHTTEKGDTWALVLKSENRVIGSIGLHRKDVETVREIGYVMHPDYWGNGYMTEAVREVIRFAFENFGIDLIQIGHFPENTRSKSVIRKCGFQYEGTLRRSYQIFDGSVKDECRYSMTREEFEAGAAEKPAYAFVQNRACEYFPCHKTNDPDHFNCLFCFCPLYHDPDCGGDPQYLENGVKDCSACLVPHYRYDRIIEKLKEHADR
jgi:putative acetyltransferase